MYVKGQGHKSNVGFEDGLYLHGFQETFLVVVNILLFIFLFVVLTLNIHDTFFSSYDEFTFVTLYSW